MAEHSAVNRRVVKELEENMDEVLNIVILGRAGRNTANIKNRQPMGQMFVKAPKVLPEMFTAIVSEELNVKEVIFSDDVANFTTYKFKPQLRTLGPKYGKLVPKIGAYLGEVDGTAFMNELKANGTVKFNIEGTDVELAESDLLIETAEKGGFVTEEDRGITVVIDTNLTPELIEEGFVREIVSKIQTMRKEADFEVMDRIKVGFEGSDLLKGVVERNAEEIKTDVLADEIVEGTFEGYAKEWNINGEKVNIVVVKK